VQQGTKGSKGPWLWPLGLAAVGVILLLQNFLFLEDFNLLNLSPLLLVFFGVQVLLRGDIAPSWDARTFGISRGSAESGTLEINAGEIDLNVRALRQSNQERLIAGQVAHRSLPTLTSEGLHAHLRLERGRTAWLSFADWEMGIARNLPWQLYLSTNLGQINLDLSELVIQDVQAASGVGDMRLVCPPEAFGMIQLHSTLGNLHIIAPAGYNVQVTVKRRRFLGIQVDESRYETADADVYLARQPDEDMPLVHVFVSGHFGNVYLA